MSAHSSVGRVQNSSCRTAIHARTRNRRRRQRSRTTSGCAIAATIGMTSSGNRRFDPRRPPPDRRRRSSACAHRGRRLPPRPGRPPRSARRSRRSPRPPTRTSGSPSILATTSPSSSTKGSGEAPAGQGSALQVRPLRSSGSGRSRRSPGERIRATRRRRRGRMSLARSRSPPPRQPGMRLGLRARTEGKPGLRRWTRRQDRRRARRQPEWRCRASTGLRRSPSPTPAGHQSRPAGAAPRDVLPLDRVCAPLGDCHSQRSATPPIAR